eukprot:scaffold14143_cov36-Phaeocystis_antarctica.AAC.1
MQSSEFRVYSSLTRQTDQDSPISRSLASNLPRCIHPKNLNWEHYNSKRCPCAPGRLPRTLSASRRLDALFSHLTPEPCPIPDALFTSLSPAASRYRSSSHFGDSLTHAQGQGESLTHAHAHLATNLATHHTQRATVLILSPLWLTITPHCVEMLRAVPEEHPHQLRFASQPLAKRVILAACLSRLLPLQLRHDLVLPGCAQHVAPSLLRPLGVLRLARVKGDRVRESLRVDDHDLHALDSGKCAQVRPPGPR